MKQRYEVRAWVDDYGVFDTYRDKFILIPESRSIVTRWCTDGNDNNDIKEEELLDDFAGKAMQGTLSNADTMREITKAYNNANTKSDTAFFERFAELSYEYAKAMLEERKKWLK